MKKKKTILILIPVLILILALGAFLWLELAVIKPYREELSRQEEAVKAEETAETERVNKLETEGDKLEYSEYSAVFLSMTECDGWSTDLFTGYIGVNAVKASVRIDTSTELEGLWNRVLASGNSITNVFLILDPLKLSDDSWTEMLKALPETEFRIFTSAYYEDYWKEFTPEEFETAVSSYRNFLDTALQYDNVVLSDYTGEDWLVENALNFPYGDDGNISEESVPKLFLYSYLWGWPVTKDTEEYVLNRMEKNLSSFATKVTEPPEEEKSFLEQAWEYHKTKDQPEEEEKLPLEDTDVVFMGDSIFALLATPYSIPSVFGQVTGAEVYNVSKGGISASSTEEEIDLCDIVELFIQEQTTDVEECDLLNNAIEEYAAADHTGRKLVFVLNCCINDYIKAADPEGEEVTAYEGAMKSVVDALKTAYPEAEIVLMEPAYLQLYYAGTYENEKGYDLFDYSAIMENIAAEYSLPIIDMKKEAGINDYNAARYLDDGTHPSPAGAWIEGNKLAEFVESLSAE